ncbi:MAG TPA: hypothetical protein VF176_08275 [Solirubrobacterales bacterium]
MTLLRRIVPPLLAALAICALAATISACGYSSDSTSVVEGEPVTLGEVDYNVIFSRFLNRNDTEDAAFLVGQRPPPPGSAYFGVFFQVQNDSKSPQPLPASLTITDADHQKFDSIPSDSLYALHLGSEIDAEDQLPALDSTPQQGSIEGSLVLFLLPDSASENRPLILEIPGEDENAEVTLDL